MAREVNETQPYSDKLVKLIPTEIVGAYMVLAGILGFAPAPSAQAEAAVEAIRRIPESDLKPILIQVVFVVLFVLTPIYLRLVTKVQNKPQLLVATLTYVVWVYTLGGPFVVWGLYYPIIGSVVLVLWSLITPLFISAQPASVRAHSAGG